MTQDINKKLLEEHGIRNLTDPAPNGILAGHDSPETAVYISSYPYGRTLRCIMRYWIERKGTKARFCSQTNDPKRPGLYWNAPKKNTYVDGVMVMTTNDDAHVHYTVLTT